VGGTSAAAAAAAAAAGGDAIVFSDLRKTYLGKVAVDNLTFGVPPGEVFGFLGINGAGKSSALKILTGDAPPTSGTASVLGADVVRSSSAARARVGYCSQTDALLDLLTTREHLELYAALRGCWGSARGALVGRTLAQFGLEEYGGKLAGSLSGGNKRKLGLALALIGAPPIVILDEPSTGVDPVAKRAMWGLIASAAATSTTAAAGAGGAARASVVLTSHSMEEVEALCTRIGIMVGGRLRCLGSAQHLRNVHGAGWTAELRIAPPGQGEVNAVVGALGAAALVTQWDGGPPHAKAAAVAGAVAGAAAAAAAAAAAGAATLGQGGWVPSAKFFAAAAALGNAPRAALLGPGRDGWALAAAAASSERSAVPLVAFAQWWVEQDRAEAAVAHVTSEACFPGSALVERQGCTLRFQVPPLAGTRLSSLFERLEGARQRFGGEEATVMLSQTTLESVFNALAAKQEAEQGVAAGFRLARG